MYIPVWIIHFQCCLFQGKVSILWMFMLFGCEYVRLQFGKTILNIFIDMVDIIFRHKISLLIWYAGQITNRLSSGIAVIVKAVFIIYSEILMALLPKCKRVKLLSLKEASKLNTLHLKLLILIVSFIKIYIRNWKDLLL